MTPEEGKECSPLIAVYDELRLMRPQWDVTIGNPSGMGWITGTDFLTATEGPFHTLLSRIGEKAYTTDRKTIASSFAVRYGWSSGVAIAPYLLYQCVPNIALDNVSLKFTENTFYERVALHRPEGVMLQREGVAPHPGIQLLPNHTDLLVWLRKALSTC